MLGNKVFGPGTFTIDVFKLPEDEFPIIVELIKQRREIIKADIMHEAHKDPELKKRVQESTQIALHKSMDEQARGRHAGSNRPVVK
jgi:3-keto-L-gulonate-6-phosphate decarboxylase